MHRRLPFASLTLIAVVMLAACGSTSVPTAPAAVPAAWVRHVLDGVSLAAPAGWHIGPDDVCGTEPADTIGASTNDVGNLGPGQAEALGVINCPGERVSATPVKPSSATVRIDCDIVSRVALPAGRSMGTAGSLHVYERSRSGFVVVGHGQAISVSAGTSAVARRILRSVVPTGRRC